MSDDAGQRGRVAILISGRGSNMLSLVEAMQAGDIRADPVVVLSNKPDAVGLGRAAELGIPTEVVDHREFKPRRNHDRAVVERLRNYQPDLICLAGYMRLLTPEMISAFPDRIFNIHPSLLPAFPGLNAQAQAIDYGVKVAGCTVHVVTEGTDEGPIVAQAAVAVEEHDTPDTLASRIIQAEHRLYPQAVRAFFEGRLRIGERRVAFRTD